MGSNCYRCRVLWYPKECRGKLHLSELRPVFPKIRHLRSFLSFDGQFTPADKLLSLLASSCVEITLSRVLKPALYTTTIQNTKDVEGRLLLKFPAEFDIVS